MVGNDHPRYMTITRFTEDRIRLMNKQNPRYAGVLLLAMLKSAYSR